MRSIIKHEIRGRIRLHLICKRMSAREADTLKYYMENQNGVTAVKVYENTLDLVVWYHGEREQVFDALRSFAYDRVQVPEYYLQCSGRALNNEYREKLILTVVRRAGKRIFLPVSVRNVLTVCRAVKYIWQGIRVLAKGRIEVAVLDATAIGVSICRGDYQTAASVIFLLRIGEILEEWTHKKSVGDLARSMSLNVSQVWVKQSGQEVLISAQEVQPDDEVVVRMGKVIPFDGEVTDGEGMVNQSSLTGEALPVRKLPGMTVYAGTVLDEGELTVRVKNAGGGSRYERIVSMIEESEKLKSNIEGKAAHLADALVPYTFLGTGAVYLLTRNVTKAMAVLMVDFSCALKLAIPISVLSAIREASNHQITVKGGKYMEAIAEADTIVFDKTGTLTKAQPRVREVIPFNGKPREELLRLAACLEEHFPHSVATAVVNAAKEEKLEHEEMHSKVQYIVAHGISSKVNDVPVVIGSYHFVMEDEQCHIPEGKESLFDNLPTDCSLLYLGIDGELAAVLCIDDPLREEAETVITKLKDNGFAHIVMMTGDSDRTAKAIAEAVGVDEYYSEVLPEDKAAYVEKARAEGHKVIMIGDGINDSLALSTADVGIAIGEGAEIAREVADVTIRAFDLHELVTLRKLAVGLMRRIHRNYRTIVGFNGSLIVLGVAGIVPPTTTALLHNMSTLGISLKNMQNLLSEEQN
ncbi:MAG: heavy metal translocating P-type ATPase [Lachnospiraceae bacterium]|nr:heavy metal translocating P-type ATPase [Lachnospiraceae bacterium]MBR1853656.1 heavy metal translocating P-type ATPase [Lachnospiraceae bacterium]